MEATLARTPRALADGRELVKKADMRDQARLSACSMVTVVWRDENQQIRYMRSLVRNISGGGALDQGSEPSPGSYPPLWRSRTHHCRWPRAARHREFFHVPAAGQLRREPKLAVGLLGCLPGAGLGPISLVSDRDPQPRFCLEGQGVSAVTGPNWRGVTIGWGGSPFIRHPREFSGSDRRPALSRICSPHMSTAY